MSNRNPKVDFYFNKEKKWQQEIEQLRLITLDCGLTEELKWGCPCYTLDDKNVVLIHVFKEYCALLFFKGVLIDDPEGVLVQQTENVQSARQMRFITQMQIVEQKQLIKEFIRKAIKVEQSGLEVALKTADEFKMAGEFKHKLDHMPDLKTAFEGLTPGRQKAYLLHFSAAKQASTREARVDKAIPQILDGKGLND